MRKRYLHPRLRVVEMDERDMLCTSGEDTRETMRVDLNDYDTYSTIQRTPTVDWDGVGTGSDF